ncbi:MAG: hypothetical protein NT169_28830 [Chloroflexi bacterium]|nr:hypothetical protein [Chloroflexota bacterium]
MLNKLLWRCPVCKTNDSIVCRKRTLRPDLVSCPACGSAWLLLRVKGGTDFRFRAIAGPQRGADRPLAAWYDAMREGFALAAITDATAPLAPGETLYLKGHAEGLRVLRMDPRFQAVIARLPPPAEPPPPDAPPLTEIGEADLFLTDRRLIVRPGPAGAAGEIIGPPLATVRGVQLFIDRYLILRHERRLVEMFEFVAESPLKWQVYLDHALRPISSAGGVKIHMAYD